MEDFLYTLYLLEHMVYVGTQRSNNSTNQLD